MLANEAVLKARIDAKGAAAGAATFKKSTDAMGRSAKNAAHHIKVLVGGIFAFTQLHRAVHAVSNYTQSMATLRAVAVTANVELSRQEEVFSKLDKTAKRLGATTKFTASEAAEGLLFLARAGFTAQEQLDAIDATLALATSSMMSLGETADLVSNVISQFALAASQTERVADALTNTANRSNTTVQQLGEAMRYAGPVAGALAVDVETASAAIGVLGDRGIQASMAGTNLRQVLLKLAAPTTAGAEAIEALGLSLDEVHPGKKGLLDALSNLGDALGRLEDQTEKARIANEIFGVRNVASGLILSENTAQLEKLTEAQRANSHATVEQAHAMHDTLHGSLIDLKSATEALYISFGEDGLTGGFRTAINGTVRLMRYFAGVREGMNDMSTGMHMAIGAVHALAMAFKLLIGVKLISMLVAAGRRLVIVGTAAAGAAAQVSTLRAAFIGLGAWMRANPFFVVIGAATALGAAFGKMTERSREARAELEEFNRMLAESSQATKDAVDNYSKAIASAIPSEVIRAGENRIDQLLEARRIAIQAERNAYGQFADPSDVRRLESFAGRLPGISFDDFMFPRTQQTGQVTTLIDKLTGAIQYYEVELEDWRQKAVEAELQQDSFAEGGLISLNKLGDAAQDAADDYAKLIEQIREATWAVGRDSIEVQRRRLLQEGFNSIMAQDLPVEEQAAAMYELQEAVDFLTIALKREKEAQEDANRVKEASKRRMKELKDWYDKLIDVIKEYVQEQDAERTAAAQSRQNARDRLKEMKSQLMTRRQLVELSAWEGEVERQVNEYRTQALLAGAKNVDELIAKYRRLVEEVEELERVYSMNAQIAQAFGDLAGSIVSDLDSITDAVERLLLRLQEVLTQQFIIDPFTNFIQKGLNAGLGAGGEAASVAAGNRPTPPTGTGPAYGARGMIGFERGGFPQGFIDTPVIFPLRNNRIAMAGEAGKEVGVRAKRLPGGDVGLEMPATRNVVVNMTVNGVQDANRWNRNKHQVIRELRQSLKEM